MKIAVAYENGNVFEHFGHSRQFKIYETDGQNIVKEEVIESEGSGHSAMAGLLAGLDINAVICGGIGGGAANALGEAGIEVYSGVSGYADEALEAYLNGELISEGVNCSHHSHEEELLIQKMKAVAVAVVVEVTQMKEAAAVEVMKHQVVAVVQVVVEEHLYLMELMWARCAEYTIKEHLTMEHSSIHLMTEENLLNSPVVQV